MQLVMLTVEQRNNIAVDVVDNMKRKYYISERVIGVIFTSREQVREFMKINIKHYYNGYSIGKTTEVKLENIDRYWKLCTA